MKNISSQEIRKIILEQANRAKVGHIGSALSVADIVAALYGNVLKINCDYSDRDRFVLSKGHSALAVYAALYLSEQISQDVLDTYCADDSLLGVHPEHHLKGIDFSTGSLGQGLSYGVGSALAAKLQNSMRKTYVLMSDAECNEGAIWEAVMFARQHKLSNLIIIIDDNKQQAFGYTKDVLALDPLENKFMAFGWKSMVVDGHNVDQLTQAMKNDDDARGCPKVIVAKTICGNGVCFMEGKIEWHYLSLSNKQFEDAVNEVEEKA